MGHFIVLVICWIFYITTIFITYMLAEQWDWEQACKKWHYYILVDCCRKKTVEELYDEYQQRLNNKELEKEYHKNLIRQMLILPICQLVLMFVVGWFNNIWGWISFVVFGISGVKGCINLKRKLNYENYYNEDDE